MRNCWIYLVLTIFVSCQVLGVAGEPENERVICHSIAVFGGSYSVVPESKIAKDAWRERYGLTITDYGVGGAGFSLLSSVSNIQFQVDNACDETKQVYDAYLLWASTNDYRLCNDRAGVSTDYTIDDGFSTEGRKTQSGGINYCIKRIKEKAPEALILFVSSTPLFDDAKS